MKKGNYNISLGAGLLLAASLVLSGCAQKAADTDLIPPPQDQPALSAGGTLLATAAPNNDNNLTISAASLPLSPNKGALSKAKDELVGYFSGGSISASTSSETVRNSVIATIAADTKRITFLDQSRFIYLNKTNKDTDYAEELVLYNLTDDNQKVLFRVTDGFPIDEYVLSPDKTLAALWRVKKPEGQTYLLGGESMITQVDLQTGETVTLLSPQKTVDIKDSEELKRAQSTFDQRVFVQYPLFYDRENRLFVDTFGPNGGYWGNGIYIISSPQNLEPYSLLPAGSYSADPVSSPDGRYILVSAPKTNFSSDRDGVEKAQKNPVSLVLIGAADNSRSFIPIEKNALVGPQYYFSPDGSLIGYVLYKNRDDSANNENAEFYLYSRPTNKTIKVSTGDGSMLLGFTKDGRNLIIGKIDQAASVKDGDNENKDKTSQPIIANSGQKYYPIFSSYELIDVENPSNKRTVPNEGFSEFVSTETSLAQSPKVKAAREDEKAQNGLLVDYFRPKNAELGTKRVDQQNGVKEKLDRSSLPKCGSLGKKENVRNLFDGKCSDSPLYLYPTAKENVVVSSFRPVYSISPDLNEDGAWKLTAYPNGTLVTPDGKEYDKISYSYQTDINSLATGIIASNENLEKSLSDYADKLGLNKKEKSDFISFWHDKLHNSAPFYQISHYLKAESANITGLTITPQPDTFIPIAMYFKRLQFPTVPPKPIFEPIPERVGFTALDWSGVVD